jgi:DNA-binding HxlR family transcriptional regulator
VPGGGDVRAASNSNRTRKACDIARAIYLVGERFTLLLARELFTGFRSYGELAAALPGIGTNLLADRLKQL